jgi:hypothetical protein
MVHELVRYMKSMNMHGEKIKVIKGYVIYSPTNTLFIKLREV